VHANGELVGHLADYSECEHAEALDLVAEGAASVYVEQLPMAAMGHATLHGGTIVGALSPNVFVGGLTFALPACVTIDGPPEFQNKVLRDMWLLSRMPSGEALFAQLEQNGKRITIVPYDDPANSFVRPGDDGDSIVHYNPNLQVLTLDRAGNLLWTPPPIGLAHELIHAEHNGSGTNAHGMDPLLPNNPREETKTIGVGSYEGAYPTENSFRRDMHLPERRDHDGTKADEPGPSMRPGKYY
jgi:hypothetical protein